MQLREEEQVRTRERRRNNTQQCREALGKKEAKCKRRTTPSETSQEQRNRGKTYAEELKSEKWSDLDQEKKIVASEKILTSVFTTFAGHFCLEASQRSKLRVRFIEKSELKESENGFCVSFLNRSIHDLLDHGVSKEPKNPLSRQLPMENWMLYVTMPPKILLIGPEK